MNHRDPTGERATGEVNREWNRMAELAVKLRRDPGKFPPETERKFIGIYRRLLTDPLEEVLRETPKGKKEQGGAPQG